MPKCDKCGSDLQVKDGVLQCPNCGNTIKEPEEVDEAMELVEIPETSPSSESDRVKQLEARIAALEEEKSERDDQEKQQLERRVAELEAEKEKKEHRFDKLKALGNSKAMVFVKKHWLYLLVGVLLFVTFLTLMITLVGLRGIYVNVNNANDFYDFDVTSYRASSIDFFTGKEELEEGKWKLSGNKLTLTIKDEFFGELSDDFDFEKVDGFKRIKIDGTEYERVSLVGLKTTQQKVKITFDPQNGQKPTVYKIKIGSTFNQDSPDNIKNKFKVFSGWYTQPDGQGDRYSIGGARVWENQTFYAYWQKPEWASYLDVDDNGTLKGIKGDKSQLPSEIIIPNIVTNIARRAFYGCTGLQTVTIGESVTKIDVYAFEGCTNLQTVTIGEGVTSIGDYAFWGCPGITTATMPALAIRYIPKDSLATVTITKGNIGKRAFYDCTNLQTVTIDEGVTSIDDSAFSGCTAITSITIPNGVTNIGEYAFYNCTGLQTVTIGEGVTSIGAYAFDGCTDITKVNYLGDLKGWCEIVFNSNPLNGTVAKLYMNDEEVSGDVEIPTGTTMIGGYVFNGLTDITSVTIPNSVTSIEQEAFSGCTGLREIAIPDSVLSIDFSAFRNCTGLQTAIINAQSIGNYTFCDCTGLQTVTLGDGVTNIGKYAFRNCTGLQTVTIGEGVTRIGFSAFYNCTDLQTVNWNAINCTETDSDPYPVPVFQDYTKLTTVKFGDKVQIIPDDAFYKCTGLREITFPDSVESIGGGAFMYCTGLQTVTIGEKVQSIGENAFYDCTGLKDIYYVGNETQWANIEKYENWDDRTPDYQLHYNSTGPSAASAEIAEENASGSSSADIEEQSVPVVWVKKQRLCA